MAKTVTFDVLAVAKAQGFDGASRQINKLGDDGTKKMHLLSTAILALGSAAVPAAGVAAGALAGLGAAGAVALLGVLGIKDAMDDGTAVGRKYEAAFKPLIGEFTTLKQIAAANMFSGVASGAKSLQALFPMLNRDTAVLSSQIGEIAGHVGPALAALFVRLNPLFTMLGDQLVHGSAAFEHWATSSDSVGRFVAYVQTNLPMVEQTLGNLITSASHVVMGLAPFGGTTLMTIKLFSQAINAIPVGVLQTLLPLIAGLKVGSSLSAGFNNASASIGKFSTKLAGAKGAVSGASGLFGSLGKAVGFLGPVGMVAGVALGGLSLIMGQHQQAAQKSKQAENDFTQALQDSSGAINDNVRQLAAKHLQDAGAFDDAKTLGVGLSDLTDAALDQGKAQALVNKLWADYNIVAKTAGEAGKPTVDQARDQYIAIKHVSAALGTENTALEDAKNNQVDFNTATSKSATSQKDLASSLGTAKNALYTSQLDALNTALDTLSGKSIDAEQQELRFKDALAGASQQVRDNGSAINDNTSKGRSNKEFLLGLITQVNGHAEAVFKQTGSVGKATAAMKTDEAQLRATAYAAGFNKEQVDALIRKYAATPKKVKTTVEAATADAAKKIKDLQHQLANLKDKTLHVTVVGTNAVGQFEVAGGGRFAKGGYLNEGLNSVGEEGQEWVVKRGSQVQVFPHGKNPAMLTPAGSGPSAGGGGGGAQRTAVVQLDFTGADSALLELFRKAVRTRGGDVQVVFGGAR